MDYSGKIITKNAVEPSQTSAPGVWTLDQAAQAVESNTWPIANVPNPISRSLRFNSADSAYLNRTFGTPTNNKIWTWSAWVKRSSLSDGVLFSSADDNTSAGNVTAIRFTSSAIELVDYTSAYRIRLISTPVYRDPSAWYHIVVAFDSTQATASNRVKIYVNNQQITSFSTADYPTQNLDPWINAAVAQYIGTTYNVSSGPGNNFNGYLTEFNFIDGQALDPTYFGMTDPRTGAWISKPYTGTYGTNGFYLNFSDNSSTAALGTDYSGNSNTWTTNNFSVTAGSGNDSMVDVPTNWVAYNTGDVGGVIRGNYATMNPLDQAGGLVFAEGNLKVTASTGWDGSRATFSYPSTGKWYWEATCIARSTGATVGILSTAAVITGDLGAAATGYIYNSGDGAKYNNGSSTSYGASWTTNDIIGIAWDAGTGTLSFYKNGASQGDAWTGLTGQFSPAIGVNGSDSMLANFGQRPFAYTPPAGFKSLCTTNLPEPTILDGGDYFDALIYTGDGTSNRSLTGLNFQPDFVWNKARSNAYGHKLYDAVRGVTKQLSSNSTDAESTTGTDFLVSFDSNGITIGSDTGFNGSGVTFVDWFWKESATSGFDIVTYTGNGTSGRTIAHNLGAVPAMIIVKSRGTTDSWGVYHASLGNTKGLYLETTSAAVTSSAFWNNTSPTSTVFSVSNNSINNANAVAYVAYLFAAVPGYSAFGSYTGNGSSDGPFVYTGFRPRWLMIKESTPNARNWIMFDAARSTYNQVALNLLPNSSDAESNGSNLYNQLDFLSNGFKFRAGTNSEPTNESGATYIYAAFAENPFKYSNAR